ncbi:hypothetical protein F5Y11DRAFT_364126 [Daldinia sp. FL1419]|nr:hypothetical protein F5Y11DRAFT_364126 [Daldinia sp. FL1419]
MASEIALTFGVELESVISVSYDRYDNQGVIWTMAEIFMKNLFRLEAPLPCACILDNPSKYNGKGYRYYYDSGHVGKGPIEDKERKNYYCFSENVSVQPAHSELTNLTRGGKQAVGLEVSTRVLDFDRQGCPELKTVITAISDGGRSASEEAIEELKPLPHSTAGLHVHIGVKNGLGLETAKNTVILGWLLEPCLFSLCDENRGNMWSHSPLRKESVLSRAEFNIPGSRSNNDENMVPTINLRQKVLLEGIGRAAPQTNSFPKEFSGDDKNRIWTVLHAQDMSTLATMTSNINATCMNKQLALGVCEREDDHTTIEFRHFQSTMDYELAWKWIRLVASLVQVASKPASEFNEKLQSIAYQYQEMKDKWRQHLQNRTFGIPTTDPWLESWEWMLSILDLQDDVPFWRDYIARLPERNQQTWGDVIPLVG